jgi:hypothetical protein
MLFLSAIYIFIKEIKFNIKTINQYYRFLHIYQTDIIKTKISWKTHSKLSFIR